MANPTEEYYLKHRCCPNCGVLVSRNTDAPVEVEETGYDGNRARCPNIECEYGPFGTREDGTQGMLPWQGIVHELIAKDETPKKLQEVKK